MTDKTIKTDGTGNYTTVQAWEDALPANLVTDGNSQVGIIYNTAEYTVAGTVLTIAGETTDATHTITLRPATVAEAGSAQGFRDNASVQSNALRYNQSNGVGLRSTTTYDQTIVISVDNVTLFGLQISNGTTERTVIEHNDSSQDNVNIDYCLIEGKMTNSSIGIVRQRSGRLRNTLIVQRSSGAGNCLDVGYTGSTTPTIVNCTFVRPSDLTAAGAALHADSGTGITIKNCAMFGFTNVENAARFTYTTCKTDKASPPSGCAQVTYANQFQNTADATRDFRLKTGADCIDTGTTDSTNAANDIAGTARPSGSAYDVGCWEFVQAGGGSVFQPYYYLQHVARAA